MKIKMSEGWVCSVNRSENIDNILFYMQWWVASELYEILYIYFIPKTYKGRKTEYNKPFFFYIVNKNNNIGKYEITISYQFFILKLKNLVSFQIS